MQLVDLLAILLVGGAGAAFLIGEMALARTEDLHAMYWLAVGVACLRAGVQIARPGAKA
jgi:alpha-D-ribose 1-methylphosphonate 5-triphosphate synthase subunit PhnG